MTTLRAWNFPSDLAAQRAARALPGPERAVRPRHSGSNRPRHLGVFVLDANATGNVINHQLADDARRLQVVLSDEQAGRIHAAFDDD